MVNYKKYLEKNLLAIDSGNNPVYAKKQLSLYRQARQRGDEKGNSSCLRGEVRLGLFFITMVVRRMHEQIGIG